MSNEVMITVQNPNALIAMAQVSQNSNNPFAIFCEYIKYCVFVNPSEVMSMQEISNSLAEKFGLDMPNNILLKCLTDVQKENFISLKKHQIYRKGTFDTDEFDKKKAHFRQTEETLIQDLIKYVNKYGKDWEYKYAREQFIKVLNANNWAYGIFLNGTVDKTGNTTIVLEQCEEQDEPLFSDSFYVGKFIEHILDTDSIQRDYLQDVCNGLMICAGAYQLPSTGNDLNYSTIKDTCFFMDTRLLLRFVGCASEAAVQAVKELIALIQNQGGKVYYFPHTLEEMNNAFDEAIKSLKNGYPPHDEEMRIYASTINNREAILTVKKANLKNELSESKIYLRPLGTYSEKERIHFGFDKNDLEQYMVSQLKWDAKVIENDASSIWETHMIREGEYSEYCGTNKRLPVFVTTNPILINTALKYKEERRSEKSISGWKSNRLPVITDIRMTCRIWSPAEQGKKLPLLFLAANAVAAQKPTQRYINTIRDLVKNFQEHAPEYSGISLPGFFDDNVTDAIFEETNGASDKLNMGTFANTIGELAEWKAKEQEDITNQVAEELDKTSHLLNNQTKDIIEGAIEQNVNKMGFAGIVVKTVFWWPILTSLVFEAISAVISKIVDSWGLLWIGVIPIVVAVIQFSVSSKLIEKKLLDIVYPWAEKKFEKRIVKRLRKSEMIYKDEIIRETKEQTELLIKCRKIM